MSHLLMDIKTAMIFANRFFKDFLNSKKKQPQENVVMFWVFFFRMKWIATTISRKISQMYKEKHLFFNRIIRSTTKKVSYSLGEL